MKGRVIAIDDGGRRAALVVDGRLEDLIIAPSGKDSATLPGTIQMARVTRVLPNGRGAFCTTDAGTEGYLRDAKSLKQGMRIKVQIVSLAGAGKAVPMTTRVLYKGPRLILTPNAPGINVSRRIGNLAERERLETVVTKALAGSDVDEGTAGVIIRSAARGAEEQTLSCELSIHLRRAGLTGEQNDLLADPLSEMLRDWLDPLPDEILCHTDLAGSLAEIGSDNGPTRLWGDDRLPSLLKPHPAPFEASGAGDQIRKLQSPIVSFSEGSMIIESTSAFVAVDVNTGADFSSAAGLKANLAAIRDLPRQLRLRGLGGQIVIDFAPVPKAQRRTMEEALKKAFRSDPVETALVGWTNMGLYEAQRKRERLPTGGA